MTNYDNNSLLFLIHQDTHGLAEALEVHNLAFAKELDYIVNIGIVRQS